MLERFRDLILFFIYDKRNVLMRQSNPKREVRYQKVVFFCKKENSALSEHTCLTNHTVEWGNSKIITTDRRYRQRLCLEVWHINSSHAPLNRDDGGLPPDAYLHLIRKKAANW